MQFRLLFLALLLCSTTEPLWSQVEADNHLTLSYRFGGFNDRVTDNLTHRERNHIIDLTYWINNEYAMAASANIIRSNLATFGTNKETTGIYSLSIRRNFLQRSKHQLYLGLGGATGDYCTCGEGLPRQQDNLLYWKYELGFDLYLHKNLGFGVHLQSNNILDKITDKYSYTVLALSASVTFR